MTVFSHWRSLVEFSNDFEVRRPRPRKSETDFHYCLLQSSVVFGLDDWETCCKIETASYYQVLRLFTENSVYELVYRPKEKKYELREMALKILSYLFKNLIYLIIENFCQFLQSITQSRVELNSVSVQYVFKSIVSTKPASYDLEKVRWDLQCRDGYRN